MGQLGFDEDRCNEIVLAVDEACTNAVRHSYAGREDEKLVLRLRADASWFEVELRDEGRPAPRECQQPKHAAVPDKDALVPGGLGVRLIHTVFDDITYTPGDVKGNQVRMRLKRPKQ